MPDTKVASHFLNTFGRPERIITCECERTAEPSMVQVLHISNGDTLNEKLQAKGNRVEKLLAAKLPNDKIVEELYLSALARLPTEVERTKLVAELSAAAEADKRQAVEDLFWGMLTSKEFLFNH